MAARSENATWYANTNRSRPVVIAYHAIWSAYGFWLPNEERGSWSTEVWAASLRRFGPATKTEQKVSLAQHPHNRQLRQEMRAALKYPPVRFTREQIDCIARGFGQAIAQFHLVLYACAILWDHVHIVSARHREPIEFVARVLKSAATRQMTQEQLHPLRMFTDPSGRATTPWAEGGWERYLNSEGEILDAVDYVNRNPPKHELPRQQWRFVTPFSGRAPRGRGG